MNLKARDTFDERKVFKGAVVRSVGATDPLFVEALCTVQVKDYAMDGLDPAAHLAWRDTHWADRAKDRVTAAR